MHKSILMGLGTLALGLALATPAVYATTTHQMQLAQADTSGGAQKAPKTKKHHKQKKQKSGKKGKAAAPQQ